MRQSNPTPGADELLLVLGADRRPRHVTGAIQRLTGYSAHELRAEPLEAFVHPDDRGALAATLDWLDGGTGSIALEARLLARDGRVLWLHWSLARRGDRDGYWAVARDITRWKREEARAVSQASVLERIAAGAPLEETLALVCRVAEGERPTLRLMVLAVDATGRHLLTAVGPSMPQGWLAAWRGCVRRPRLGPEGQALGGEPAVVADTDAEPAWPAWRDLALAHGLPAAWASPLGNAHGKTVGALVAYPEAPGEPGPEDRQALATAASLAAIALARDADERELRQLRAAVEHVNDIVMLTEPVPSNGGGRRVLYVNRAFERLTGYPREELLGRTLRLLQGPDTGRETLRRIGAALDQWQPVREEVLNYARDGHPFWLEIDLVPVVDAEGRPTHWASIGRDITARRDAAAIRARAEQEARLGQLAGSVAHEFNNLLAVVLGSTGLARLQATTGQSPLEALAEVEAAAQRAAGLVRQMLAASGKARTESLRVDVGPIVAQVVRALEPSLGHRVALELREADGLPPVVGDPRDLTVAIQHLLAHAVDALRGGFGRVRVTTDVVDADPALLDCLAIDDGARAGRYVVVEVADNGPGMDDATRRRILDPFLAAESGRGIGLAGVYATARAHGGLLQLTSDPGEGTTVRIYLPAADAAATAATWAAA